MARAKSKVARNTIWMSFGLSGRIIFQIIYFLIIARSLGPDAYGAFAGAIALVVVFSPFVGWGSGSILIQQVSRQTNEFKAYWGLAKGTTLVTATIFTIISGASAAVVLSPTMAIRLTLPIALGTYFGDGFAILAGQSFQAFNRLSRTSLINLLLGLFRLLSAILLLLLPISKSTENWAILYMFSGLLAGILGVIWVNHDLGDSPASLKLMQGKWKVGFYFSIGQSAQGVYNDIDKTLLMRLVSESISGVYAASYRIMDATFLPVRALLSSTYSNFFKKGENGVTETFKYAKKILPWSLIMGVVALLGILLIAPIIPVLLGDEYQGAVLMVRWLSIIPLFRSLHYLAADALTGAGFQNYRSYIQIGVALLNLSLNLWLIPLYSWKGAVWASLASDGFLAFCLWLLIIYMSKKQIRSINEETQRLIFGTTK